MKLLYALAALTGGLSLALPVQPRPIGAQLFSAKICRDSRGRFVKCPVPTPTPTPTPTPAPTPSPVTSETPIPDNFDVSQAIEPTWYGPNGRGGIAPASADPVGAFREFCAPGQLLRDDPLVYPGQPGVSPHLHQFFGNLGTNGNSNWRYYT
jgi:hypothetical protein